MANDRFEVVGTRSGSVFRGVFACRRGSDRRIDVEQCACVDVNLLKLRGAFVAYDVTDDVGEEYSRELVVRDLREEVSPEPGTSPGHQVDTQDTDADYPVSPTGPFLGRFGLGAGGSVAFTVWHAGRWRVASCRLGCRAPAVLDRRPGIDPSYLKIRSGTVRWRRRGALRSARLR